MVSSGKSADQNDPSDELQQRVSPSVVTRTEGKDSDTTACASETDQEGAAHSPLQSVQETPSTVREKVSKDGYNWRKYGQKHVKGNEFIRSYYKCTHTNCQAKKQLQQSNEGHITDSICIGQHNHPRPQLNSVTVPLDCVLPPAEPVPQKLSFANVEDKASVEHGCMPQHIKPLHSLPTPKVSQANEFKPAHLQLTKVELHDNADPIPESKRLKKDNSNADATGVDMSTCESRVVVQTSSEVDLVNDGYRWRKYGQKLVKGNANPRSYYRCSNSGCPVKKHVERASHDSKIVITTYEGQHDHEIPPGRIVTHNVATTNTQTMTTNGKLGNQSGGNSTVCIDPGSRLSEQLNGESITKLKASDPVEIGMISLSNEGPESKFSKEEQQNDSSGTKDDSVNKDIMCLTCISNEELKDEVKTTSEGNKDCHNVLAVHDTPDTENEFNKQSASDAEPVQS